MNVIRKNTHHFVAEIFWNDNRGVVFTRLHAGHGIFLAGKHPIHLRVFAQGRQHLITDIDANGNQTAFVTVIDAGYGYF